MTRREQLIEVFADTQRFYTENHVLAEAVKSSCDHTRFYDVNDYPVLPNGRFSEIEFAIYCRDYETENYIAFASQFGANR